MTTIIYKKPKGTLDLYDNEYNKFKYYKTQLEEIFIANNGIPLETPNFELENILLNKYGKETENKLIFKIENCGSDMSEKYALRYDLTIPLERFIIENGIKKIRRYSINKVFRRDQPSEGRYREFYQADFDIIGENNENMINEFILLKMAMSFLKICGIIDYKILINDTQNLKNILIDKIKINPNNFKDICQTIDKLDKYKYEEIKQELQEKGLNEIQIKELEILLNYEEPIDENTKIKFNKLKSYCDNFSFANKLFFTSNLARGLDYYNGFIFEIKVSNFKSTVISGGRYDNLIPNTTMIGISFGLSRLLGLLNYKDNEWKNLYYLTSIGKNIDFAIKLKVMAFLENKFDVKILLSDNENSKKLVKEINYCIENKIKFMFVIGENEYANNKIILKNLENKTQEIIDLT